MNKIAGEAVKKIKELEANQNFSKVTRMADKHGMAVILKNNVPRYLVIDFTKAEK